MVLKFNNSSLNQDRLPSFHPVKTRVIIFYLTYKLERKSAKRNTNPSNNLTIKSCLRGTIKLSKNSDKKYVFNSRGIVFDCSGTCKFKGGKFTAKCHYF